MNKRDVVDICVIVGVFGLLIAAAFRLPLPGASCRQLSKDGTSLNSDYNVHKLFTVDGCTVYKFGKYNDKYFTNCAGAVQYTIPGSKNSLSKEYTID